jgi:hypothetical protein
MTWLYYSYIERLRDNLRNECFIYLFIHSFATSIALGQVNQGLKHKSNVPSQTILQDLHKFNYQTYNYD